MESECTPRPLFMDDDEFDNDDYPATPLSCNSRQDYSITPIMLNLPDEDDEGHHEALMSQRYSCTTGCVSDHVVSGHAGLLALHP